MSLQFNDTATFKGLVQIYEKEIGANQGDVSGSTTKLKSFTADVNLALDDLVAMALRADGTWQFDDTNHTDYPEMSTALVSGTRRYAWTAFSADAGSNLVLDVYKVMVKDPNGTYQELAPVDVQGQSGMESFFDGLSASGTPTRYDKTGKWLDLDPVPNYSQATGGIKAFINREASYFAYTDTTKKAGVPGLFHRYLAVKPAYDYCRVHNPSLVQGLLSEILRLEEGIKEYFGARAQDERTRLMPIRINFR